MIIDAISDLHGHYPKLEGGDLLIVAGDLTGSDNPFEYEDILEYLTNQNYTKVILIAGNHDNILENMIDPFLEKNLIYLRDSGTEFEGLKIWGSPWTKTFKGINPKCKAFTCDTEEELADKWAIIPDDIDILITHTPPFGILDQAKKFDYPAKNTKLGYFLNGQFQHVGSKSLSDYVGHMETPPKLWIWGHIHEAYGKDGAIREKPCIMINASQVNERYKPVNKPVRVVL